MELKVTAFPRLSFIIGATCRELRKPRHARLVEPILSRNGFKLGLCVRCQDGVMKHAGK
ncbi:hypothetical protein O5O45_15745 [Hahella aquimaris]|uniref:hypothetical protein n=1 Tax=Hahella sp. HNIBRBA332 TaxID=3015983 RepID=UPI00273B5828|nr:hypothetical protein [Hahella sp. HNIBRBA332]WLQ17365.1 hypothetical protein O5O45_15745 [Hahella sp. HNIBRBA332]